MANAKPQLRTDSAVIQARLHSGAGGNYVWVTNPSRTTARAKVTIANGQKFTSVKELWGDARASSQGPDITVEIPARDAAVIRLDPN